jgi:hypothetical protein
MYVLVVDGFARVVLYSQHERGDTLNREAAKSYHILMLGNPRLAVPGAVGRVVARGGTIRTVDHLCRVWAGRTLVYTGEPLPPR